MRTDMAIVQLPNPIPNWGGLLGKNTIVTDPDFGTKIVRISDSSDNKNATLKTADSPGARIWNADETMIILRSSGGGSFLRQFNPTKMQISTLQNLNGRFCFSPTQASVLYQLTDSVVSRLVYKRVSGVWTYQKTTPVCDFSAILPPGFKVNWTGTFAVSSDDSTFLVGLSEGAQNSAIHCCIYQRGHGDGKGYRLLNTQSGEVSGDWGQVGTSIVVSPVNNIAFPFGMHECEITPNKDFAMIGAATKEVGGRLVWNIPTLTITDPQMTGHAAKGYLHFYAGGPGGGQMAEVPYDNPTTKRLIVPLANLPGQQTPAQHYDGDRHFGFGKIDPLDHSTFWVTSSTAPAGLDGTSAKLFTSAWMNEVFGYDAQTGVVSRACHTFNSGRSTEFIVAHAIGIPSPKGRFVAFASDAMGTLGSTAGGANSTLGTDARGDVFVVKVA